MVNVVERFRRQVGRKLGDRQRAERRYSDRLCQQSSRAGARVRGRMTGWRGRHGWSGASNCARYRAGETTRPIGSRNFGGATLCRREGGPYDGLPSTKGAQPC